MQDNLPPYAPITKRMFARLIDIGLISVPLSMLTILSLVYLRSLPLAIALIVLDAVYKPLAEGKFGYTIGKKWLKIRVVDQASGRLMNLNQNLTRFLPWALVYFTTIFVYVRYFQDPAFAEVLDAETFINFIPTHQLNNSFLVSLLNNATVFSAVWMFSDPYTRALHDRLAGTVVVSEATSPPGPLAA